MTHITPRNKRENDPELNFMNVWNGLLSGPKVALWVQLGPLGTAATDWPIVACPGWLWWWIIWWTEDWQGKPKYSEETHRSTTLSTTNPTWPDPAPNPGRLGGKPETNRLTYGAAEYRVLGHVSVISDTRLCTVFSWMISWSCRTK
jgi:hypothetical protein